MQVLVAALLASALVLTGCGQAAKRDSAAPPSPSPSPSPAARVPTESELKAALLATADLPSGYAVDTDSASPEPESSSQASNAECAKLFDSLEGENSPLEAGKVAEAEIEFNKSGLGPYLSQSLVSVRDREALKTAFADVRKVVTTCGMFTETDADGKTTVTMVIASFTTFGDETLAVKMDAKVEAEGGAITLGGYLVLVRVGNVASMVGHFGVPGVDAAETEKVVKAAADKLAPLGKPAA